MICRDLDKLKEPFKSKVECILCKCEQKGLNFKPFETYRDDKRQKYLYRLGTSKIIHSKHQDGLACDFVIFENNRWSWSDIGKYKKLGDIVHEFPDLVWGGDWKKFKDYVHVEQGG